MRVLNQRQGARPSSTARYVGRPSKFGNPFVVGRDGARGECVVLFEKWIESQPALKAAARAELKGMDLICWCAPLACHADVLLRIANEEV